MFQSRGYIQHGAVNLQGEFFTVYHEAFYKPLFVVYIQPWMYFIKETDIGYMCH